MKKEGLTATQSVLPKKNILARLFDETHAKKRNLIHMLFALLAVAGIVITLFLPICDIRVSNRWFELIPAEAMDNIGDSRMGSYIYMQLATFLALLAALGVGGCYLIRCLFCMADEEKMIRSAKGAVIFSTVVIAIFTVFSFLFSPINLLIGGACRTNASFAAVNYIIVVVVVYAIFVGLIGYFKEQREDAELFEKRALELRKKQYRMLRNRKIELLIYALLNIGVTVAALLSKIMTVTFKSELADIPMYTLSGYRLLLKPGEFTSKNERIVGFIVFALLVICLTCAFLSLISFLSRSLYFNKIAVFSVIAGTYSALFVGLMGQYYRIIQQLNFETIQQIIAEYTEYTEEYIAELVQFTIKSNTIFFFLADLVIVAILFLRRSYTRAVELEQQILAQDMANLPQTVEIAEREDDEGETSTAGAALGAPAYGSTENPNFDPCPAFTDLDRKEASYEAQALENQQHSFENPTLPALVDFIVQYARNSEQHLFYTPETIAAFLAGLGTTRLTILQGMSGTGKTSLPKIVAEALLSVCDLVEVESSWRDKNELLGYYNEFNKVYTPKKFTQMLYRAKLNPDAVTLIVLDEMNLSRIEYYFSDFLSLMENAPDKRELKLLNTPLFRTKNGKRIAYKGLTDGHTVKIPQNVWFVGTANRDESTYDISDKVYDRAHTMNFDKRAARVQYYSESMTPRYISAAELTELFEDAKRKVPFSLDQHPVVGEVEKLLEPYNISFGNRVAMQMESFVSIYASCFAVTDAVINDGLEIILLSKVVRKLELKSIMDKESLASEFDRLGLQRCSRFIRELRED